MTSRYVRPEYQARMMLLWGRSSVMWLSLWKPLQDGRGRPVLSWRGYYTAKIASDVEEGLLTRDEADRLRDFLDMLGDR